MVFKKYIFTNIKIYLECIKELRIKKLFWNQLGFLKTANNRTCPSYNIRKHGRHVENVNTNFWLSLANVFLRNNTPKSFKLRAINRFLAKWLRPKIRRHKHQRYRYRVGHLVDYVFWEYGIKETKLHQNSINSITWFDERIYHEL